MEEEERELIARSAHSLRRTEDTVNAQIAMINCRDPHQRQLMAADVLATMQNGLADSRTDHLKTVTLMVRRLRLDLLHKHAERGALLLQASALPMLLYRKTLNDFKISRKQARECIVLHQRWSDFVNAERWNWAAWHLPPDNPREALRLVALWHQDRRPLLDATEH